MGYFEELSNKNFVGNVIIRFLGEYFSLRKPDAGLDVLPKYDGLISSLVLNPTSIDPRRVSTTISSYSFKLVDKNLAVTQLVKERGADLIGEEVEIWIGRNAVGMPFSDYYKLPITNIKAISRQDNGYSFSTTEDSDRMNRPIYDSTARLFGDILPSTNVFTVQEDITEFPANGYLRIGSEIVKYTSKNNATKQFSGIVRGEFNTFPVAYRINESVYLAEFLTDNPINILLKILCSNGGGGAYDVLKDGLGIGTSLLDIAEIESIRDNFFVGTQFTLAMYNIPNALKFLESEILAPCNLRFTYSKSSKLSLAVLDTANFVDSLNVIDEDTMTDFPKWDVNDTRIVNEVEVNWDYDDSNNSYKNITLYEDAASIAAYGRRAPLKLKFKGIKTLLGGQTFLDNFVQKTFLRLAEPSPEISVKTHIDKSTLNIGQNTILNSSMMPNELGNLNFASELEIINRAINYQTGEVSLKLAFTTFTGIRSCYIAPSDTIASVVSQSVVNLGAGRGDLWEVGFKVRLWDNVANAYLPDAVNEIASITGDQITFVNAWSTALLTTHKIKFADYDDCNSSQKRYCFVGDNLLDFLDSGKRYNILP